jgi:hypothetical protein
VNVVLGMIARTYAWNQFDPAAWLNSPQAGLGERFEPIKGGRYLYAEVAASRAATLTLHDLADGKKYDFALGEVVPGRELEARSGGARVEILEAEKTWLHDNRLISQPDSRISRRNSGLRLHEERTPYRIHLYRTAQRSL